MALAGFDKKILKLRLQMGYLLLNQSKIKDEDDDNSLYKGISKRNFTRKFTLADDIL